MRNFFHIFPYDGMIRIRFAGQGVLRPISAGSIRHPEDKLSIPAEKAFVKRPRVWYTGAVL